MKNDNSKLNILITGGSGFIGRNLEEYLQNKYQVFAPTHQELDLLDTSKIRKFIKKNNINIIIHSAVTSGKQFTDETRSSLETNLRMFFNIASCEELVSKIINFGSGAEYDKSRDIIKINEEEFDERVPEDNYGFYKYVCSKYILAYNRHSGERSDSRIVPGRGRITKRSWTSQDDDNKLLSLRLFGVYGKYENYLFKFISNAIVKNLLKMPIIIGQNVFFDYLYIDDLVKIVEYFISNQSKHRDYNIGTGEKVDLLTISKIINKVSEYQSEIIVKNKGLNLEYTADNSRLRRVIPNLMITPIDEGIRKLYRWYKIHLQEIDKEKVKEDQYLKYININNA